MLNIDTISLFEQRILTSLLFPSFNLDNKYLLKLSNCWSQIQPIILQRYDTQTIEILCDKASYCNASLLPNFSTIISNIESILASNNSIRLQKTRRALKIELDKNNQPMSWGSSIKHRTGLQQLAVFKVFEQFSKAEYVDNIKDKALFISRNYFWKYYFKNGLVKHSRLLVMPESKKRVEVYSNNTAVLTDSTKDEFAIMFHIGDTVFIEWANPGSFYSIAESDSACPNFIDNNINLTALKQKIDSTKHRANSYGFWQYRVAFSLRSSVGIQPSRSDYQLRKNQS